MLPSTQSQPQPQPQPQPLPPPTTSHPLSLSLSLPAALLSAAASPPTDPQTPTLPLTAIPAGPPPPGITPNFTNPPSHAYQAVVVNAVFLPLAVVVVVVRVLSRRVFLHFWGGDDSLAHGLGRHIWDVSLSDYISFLRLSLVEAVFYVLATGSMKISIILFYLRVFPPPSRATKVCRALIAFIFCYTLASTLVNIFLCSPVRKFWDVTIEGGRCVDRAAFYYANAGLLITTDVLTLVIPIVCIISIIRLHSLYILATKPDMTWHVNTATIWSLLEVYLGIILGSGAALRPLFLRFFPDWIRGHRRSSGESAASTASRDWLRRWETVHRRLSFSRGGVGFGFGHGHGKGEGEGEAEGSGGSGGSRGGGGGGERNLTSGAEPRGEEGVELDENQNEDNRDEEEVAGISPSQQIQVVSPSPSPFPPSPSSPSPSPSPSLSPSRPGPPYLPKHTPTLGRSLRGQVSGLFGRRMRRSELDIVLGSYGGGSRSRSRSASASASGYGYGSRARGRGEGDAGVEAAMRAYVFGSREGSGVVGGNVGGSGGGSGSGFEGGGGRGEEEGEVSPTTTTTTRVGAGTGMGTGDGDGDGGGGER
ncbi:hypothetical protein FQN53_002489 [Emmonsiellopsis sp. PD_33]|nr:hypothetical protein FQN53_002489 [Emmonsiellopsis sp. PD_33]